MFKHWEAVLAALPLVAKLIEDARAIDSTVGEAREDAIEQFVADLVVLVESVSGRDFVMTPR